MKAKVLLPWWPRGWESSCQCRGLSFDPWPRKTPHALGQLSPCATSTEAQAPWSLWSAARGVLLAAAGESPRDAKDRAQPKTINSH